MKNVLVFYDHGSNTLEIATGNDRLARGFPRAEFDTVGDAEVFVSALKNCEFLAIYFLDEEGLPVRVGEGEGPYPTKRLFKTKQAALTAMK